MAAKGFFILLTIGLALNTEGSWRHPHTETCKKSHLYDHYGQRGCQPVLGEDGCPTKFECDDFTPLPQKCYFDGKWYEVGSAIDTACSGRCICEGKDGISNDSIPYTFRCTNPLCYLTYPVEPSCYYGYRQGECCPHKICPSEGESATSTTKCTHNGIEYRLGDEIPVSDPCKRCICTTNFTGNESECERVISPLDPYYVRRLREQGCLPVFLSLQDSCEPFYVYCGDFGSFDTAEITRGRESRMCRYKNAFYTWGTNATFHKDGEDIDCTCSVPPDFTCHWRGQYTRPSLRIRPI